MPRKKTAEDGETPTPAKTPRKKKVEAEAETIGLEPDEADLQDDTLSNVAPVVPGALTNVALAAGEDRFSQDELDDDDASGLEIQLGVLTGQIEELARAMATMAEKLDRIEAVVRSSANRSSESRGPSRDDRPRREFQPRDDRPKRDFQPRSDDRPQRTFSRDDRPKRDFQPRDDRSGGDRPQRSFAPRGDARGPSDRPRSDASRERPAQRGFQPRDDRPKRDFQPRGDARGPSDRPQRSFSPRPEGDRGPARGNDSRGGFSRGFDRGHDSRGPARPDSRGSDSRGSAPARGFPPRPERSDRPIERPKTESGSSEPRGFGRRKDHGFGGVEVKRREED
jgi:hypothetical protein